MSQFSLKKYAAHIGVLFKKAEYLNEVRIKLVAAFQLRAVEYVVEIVEKTILCFVQHIVYIGVVKIECSPVNVGKLRQLLYRYLIDRLFLHQRQQRLLKSLFRVSDASVFISAFVQKITPVSTLSCRCV